jgi:hypothetical protein
MRRSNYYSRCISADRRPTHKLTFRQTIFLYAIALVKRKAARVNFGGLRHIVAAHTGQSSQLFAKATRRMLGIFEQLREVLIGLEDCAVRF